MFFLPSFVMRSSAIFSMPTQEGTLRTPRRSTQGTPTAASAGTPTSAAALVTPISLSNSDRQRQPSPQRQACPPQRSNLRSQSGCNKEKYIADCEKQLGDIEAKQRQIAEQLAAKGHRTATQARDEGDQTSSSDLHYPEPSAEWLEEVSWLQVKVAQLSAREAELQARQRNRMMNIEEAAEANEAALQTKTVHVEERANDRIQAIVEQYNDLCMKDLKALVYISNERCNALNALFEMKLKQVLACTAYLPFGIRLYKVGRISA